MCVASLAKTAGKAQFFNPGGVMKGSIWIHIIIDLWWSHLSTYTFRTNRFLVESSGWKIDSFSMFQSLLDETNSYKDNEIKYEESNIKSEILYCSLFLNIGIVWTNNEQDWKWRIILRQKTKKILSSSQQLEVLSVCSRDVIPWRKSQIEPSVAGTLSRGLEKSRWERSLSWAARQHSPQQRGII